MKKIIIIFSVLFPMLGFAQTEKIQGTYYSNTAGDDLRLKINNDGTFDLVIFSGKYIFGKDGNVDLLIDKTPSFMVEAKERNSGETLKIKFKASYQMNELQYVYVGYEQNGKVEYVNLYDKIPTSEEAISVENENAEQIYEIGVLEIPKTENLYLVNALPSSLLFDSSQEKSVFIEKYSIGKEVSLADVFFSLSALYASSPKLTGAYSEANQTLRINSFYGSNSVVFNKQPHYEKEGVIKPVTIENVRNWEHLKFFETPYDYYGYNEGDSTSVAVETRIKLDIKNNLSDALQAAKKEDKPLVVFYQPENTENARKAFDDLIKRYEEDLRYYASYNLEKYNQIDFYFADKKDEKWFKKKNIKAQNQLVLLDGEGNVIYHEGRQADEFQDNFSITSPFLIALRGAYLARKVDNVFSNPKATPQQIEDLFSKILDSELPLFLYTDQKISKNETEQDSYDKEHYEFYFNSFKDRATLYKFKSTPEQVNRQWAKMVEAHKNDTKLNVSYAALMAKNYYSFEHGYGVYFQNMFNTSKKTDIADLDAIQYLMKYGDEIEKYNDSFNYDSIDNQQQIDFYYTNIPTILNTMAESSPELREKIKEIYLQEQEKKLAFFQDFKTFLEAYYPDEFLKNFADYYTKMTSADSSNLILSLDKMYAESRSGYDDWIYYKLRFSNDCNNAAWKVVENYRNDATWMQKALQWSKASLELDANNPYCLDTYAHLLYFTGDKAKAIENQRKAVRILDQDKEKYNQGNEDDIREVLKKMENGTL